jgi:serine/threonine protein kinase
MSPEHLKFGKQDSASLVWQLGTLLYRVAFNDNHPFLIRPSASPPLMNTHSSNQLQNMNQLDNPNMNPNASEVDQLISQNTGLIQQTRRNILLIRYKRASTDQLRYHKLQQVFDRTFCDAM